MEHTKVLKGLRLNAVNAKTQMVKEEEEDKKSNSAFWPKHNVIKSHLVM